MQTTEIIQF